MKFEVIPNGIKQHSLVVSTLSSLNKIGLEMSEYKTSVTVVI